LPNRCPNHHQRGPAYIQFVERDLFHFKVDFERRLADRWWIFLTPRLRIYDYVDRSSGRIDAISSIGTGIRYEVTENIDLTSSIAYESRASGVAGVF